MDGFGLSFGKYLVSFIVYGLVMAAVTYKLAKEKGHHSPAMLGLLGFFFGIVTLLYAVGMPDYVLRKKLSGMEGSSAADDGTSKSWFRKAE